MKKLKKVAHRTENSNKKKYNKPKIVHSSKIETLAGSCAATSFCTPNYS